MLDAKLVAIILAASTAGAWTQRDAIVKQWQIYVQKKPVATQTVIYTWTDKAGVVHYDSRPENQQSQELIIDTAQITPLAPPPPPLKKVEEPKPKLALTELREELERQRQQMQEAKLQRILQE